LPSTLRAVAKRDISAIADSAVDFAESIDQVLRRFAISPLAPDEPDPEAGELKKSRSEYLKSIQAAYPGVWRASATRGS
jgi:hypothetical protein